MSRNTGNRFSERDLQRSKKCGAHASPALGNDSKQYLTAMAVIVRESESGRSSHRRARRGIPPRLRTTYARYWMPAFRGHDSGELAPFRLSGRPRKRAPMRAITGAPRSRGHKGAVGAFGERNKMTARPRFGSRASRGNQGRKPSCRKVTLAGFRSAPPPCAAIPSPREPTVCGREDQSIELGGSGHVDCDVYRDGGISERDGVCAEFGAG
jgi:hypothetical protein